ncbi:hypothetical protein [Flavobacterium ginsengiterrae]|uniref:Uncharacterized protein n=1 Tax=Flavobacterium ginsengiterrae TaxID=871695 RepID=A0ABP7H4T3_9FLAO
MFTSGTLSQAGVYVCSAVVAVTDSKIHKIPEPENEYAASDPDKYLKDYMRITQIPN